MEQKKSIVQENAIPDITIQVHNPGVPVLGRVKKQLFLRQ
jgi:hypothetical protein